MFTTEISVIILLLVINAFFAMSEMAVVSVSKPLLRQMSKQGNRRAARALALAEDSGRFLSTVQVGITLVGTMAGAYGGATIADKLEEPFNEIAFINPHGDVVAVVLVVSLITYLSVVVGELVPKQIALRHSTTIAMFVARPMSIISTIFAPLVRLLDLSGMLVMRAFGIFSSDEQQISEAEVKAVIAEGAQSGAIEPEEHLMLQRIIRLGDRDVKSIMTHRTDVTFIDVNDTQEIIRRKVHESGHSRYPVTNDNNAHVIGLVQTKDLLDGALANPHLDIRAHLKKVTFLPDSTPCLKALEVFKTGAIQLAIIVDEHGATDGILTISDLMEAIVGLLPSNYDEGQEAMIIQRHDGSWLVDGKTPIDEIHLTIGIEEIDADGQYETIAGFLIDSAGRSLESGERIEKYGYQFEVVDMDGRRIDKVLISQSAPTES